MDLVEKGSVIDGQRQIGRRQATRCGAHHRRQLCIGSGLHAFPAQRRRKFAARFQSANHGIAGVGQRLAVAPQRQRIAAPLCIGLAGGQARGQLCAAQAEVVGGLPVGQQRVPVLPTRHRRQPRAAEAFSHGLTGVTLQNACAWALETVSIVRLSAANSSHPYSGWRLNAASWPASVWPCSAAAMASRMAVSCGSRVCACNALLPRHSRPMKTVARRGRESWRDDTQARLSA